VAALACVAFPAGAGAASSFSTGILDIDSFQSSEVLPFQRAEAAGTTYLKDNLFWSRTVAGYDSPTKPGTDAEPFNASDPASPYYDWSIYDRFVRNTVEYNMVPILTLTNAPRWARKGCADSETCYPNPADFAAFAKAAARRYSGTFDPGDGQGVLPRVKYWQAWVEPNLEIFYQPVFSPGGKPVSPDTYRTLLNAFYDAIHSVKADNLVMSAGLAPNGVRNMAISPLDFTRRVLCMTGSYNNPRPKPGCNAKTKADIWSVHPYTTGAPTHLPQNPDNMTVAALPRMTKLLKAANRAGRLSGSRPVTPLWVTEFSWDSKAPDPGGLPWKLHTRWVAQAMYLMYKANVDTMIWFGLRDEDRSDGRPYNQTFESGLYLRGRTMAQDRPKMVLNAFSYPFVANRTGSGFNYWGRTPDSSRATVQIYARKKAGGAFVKVATTRTNSSGVFKGQVRGRGYTPKGSVRAKIVGGPGSVPFGLEKTRDFFQPPFG
jgi:hypothetical protein